jgi:hypothetical protein
VAPGCWRADLLTHSGARGVGRGATICLHPALRVAWSTGRARDLRAGRKRWPESCTGSAQHTPPTVEWAAWGDAPGRRPPLPYEVALSQPWHLARLQTLPGLTGVWQVRGRGRVSVSGAHAHGSALSRHPVILGGCSGAAADGASRAARDRRRVRPSWPLGYLTKPGGGRSSPLGCGESLRNKREAWNASKRKGLEVERVWLVLRLLAAEFRPGWERTAHLWRLVAELGSRLLSGWSRSHSARAAAL